MDEVRRVKQNAILTMIGDYAVIYQLLHQVPWRCLSFVNESNSNLYFMSQIRVRMRLLNTKCLRERVTVQLDLFMENLKNTKGVIRNRK
jgi:hypothetical protein